MNWKIRYIKPFRTIEDLHVTSAISGYLFRIACQYDWGREIKQTILCLIVTIRTLVLSDPGAPAVHILTGDVLSRTRELIQRIDPYWEAVDKDTRDAWNRDKALMDIAGKARLRRLETAWAVYQKKDSDEDFFELKLPATSSGSHVGSAHLPLSHRKAVALPSIAVFSRTGRMIPACCKGVIH